MFKWERVCGYIFAHMKNNSFKFTILLIMKSNTYLHNCTRLVLKAFGQQQEVKLSTLDYGAIWAEEITCNCAKVS